MCVCVWGEGGGYGIKRERRKPGYRLIIHVFTCRCVRAKVWNEEKSVTIMKRSGPGSKDLLKVTCEHVRAR